MLKRLAFGLTLTLTVPLAVCPRPARAQEVGWFVEPSFGITEEYDDNILRQRSNEQSDFISRFSPGLRAGHRSRTLTLLGGYTFDAEVFADHSELNSATSRQRAELDFHYVPTRLLTLDLGADYGKTNTATDLDEDTGIELGRVRATRIRVRPFASYRFDPLTSGDARYLFNATSVAGGRDTTTQRVELRLTRQLTPLDSGLASYRVSVFESDESEATSHTPMIGWTRLLGKSTVLSVRAGPRFTDGDVDPEVYAELGHRFRQARASVKYVRTEGLVIGSAGPVDVERASGRLEIEPLRFLEVELEPSVRKISREPDRDTTVYEFMAAVTYHLTRWLSARAEYRYRFQQRESREIERNVYSIGLHARYPVRVD